MNAKTINAAGTILAFTGLAMASTIFIALIGVMAGKIDPATVSSHCIGLSLLMLAGMFVMGMGTKLWDYSDIVAIRARIAGRR